MTAEGLTEAERQSLWNTIALVRDAAPRTPEDASTDDIIDAILDSGWVYNLLADRLAPVQAERDALRERVEALAEDLDARATHVATLSSETSTRTDAYRLAGKAEGLRIGKNLLRAALDADHSTDPSAGSERA